MLGQLRPVNSSTRFLYLEDVQEDMWPEAFNLTETLGLRECYCAAVLEADGYDQMKKEKISDPTAPSDAKQVPLCQDWFQGKIYAGALSMAAVGGIVFVNLFLEIMLNLCVKFERHENNTSRVKSLTFKLFAAMFVNTALLTLLINGTPDVSWRLPSPTALTPSPFPQETSRISSASLPSTRRATRASSRCGTARMTT